MDIPVSHTFRIPLPEGGFKDEVVLFPLLSTAELAPMYAMLKAERLQALKDSLRDVGGIDPLKQVEMLHRERTQYYNIFLVVDYAGTLGGMDAIFRMSLSKATPPAPARTPAEIDRIMSLPIKVLDKERLAVQILNPTEDGKPPAKDTPAGTEKDVTQGIKAFGAGDTMQDAMKAAAGVSSGPPSAPTPNGP